MIISSGTFDQVQAQLRQLRQESSGVKTDQPLVPPPPPPASGTVSQSFNQQTLGATSGIDLSCVFLNICLLLHLDNFSTKLYALYIIIYTL